ncbi:MAG TPA: VWA domain-containing protein, partial [Candidatus Binataceae bacterium]|nr:VWA domain-containing protein [Candidatus Binataceae bacterium]
MPEYITNASERQLCMLVLDASQSMQTRDAGSGRARIELLNQGIETLYGELRKDEKALVRVQIAAIRVGGATDEAREILDWTDGVDFRPFSLRAGQGTPLGAGVLLALKTIEAQKAVLRSNGISLAGRPWLFVMTDGEPTDTNATWQEACETAQQHEAGKKVSIYSIGIGEANLGKLSQLNIQRSPQLIQAVDFTKLFIFVSTSISAGGIRDDVWADV